VSRIRRRKTQNLRREVFRFGSKDKISNSLSFKNEEEGRKGEGREGRKGRKGKKEGKEGRKKEEGRKEEDHLK